jgi:hypothetical protein
MSKKPHRKSKKSIQLMKEQSGHTPKRSDWEQLSANPVLSAAFQELSVSLQRSQALAEQRAVRSSSGAPSSEFLDFSHALAVIDAHPELVPYIRELQAGDHRELLRQSTMTPEFQRQSPTASYPQAQGTLGGWSYTDKNQPQGVPNTPLLRYYADNNVWTRAAINERRTQIGSAEIAVMPGDPRRRYDRKAKANLELILDQPNERRQNWPELISSCLEDVLVLGRGAISKNMTVDRKPVGIYAEDAATVKIYPEWDGDPDKPRYVYEEPGSSRKVPLRNDELIMPFFNPATYRFSLSPVQVLMDVIKADIEATRQALRTMQQKPPPHAFQIPNASATQLEALRNAYDNNIGGMQELFWFGGPNPAQHFPLIFSARDNQFLEYQVYMVRKICAAFQISSQQLSITFDINRATAQTQEQHSEDAGLIPLLLLMEGYLNRELVADYAPPLPYGRYDLYAVNLRVMFPMVSEQARQLHAREALEMAEKGLAGLPSMTINQVLAARGEMDVPGGNTFYIATATGAVPWLSYDGETGDYVPISTGGTLGSQDASGGPDSDSDDPGFSDDSGGSPADSENASNGGDTPSASGDSAPASGDTGGSAEKSLWYDARPPGMPWKPKYMQRYALPISRKSAGDALIPKAERKARKELKQGIAKIFNEAAERGKRE